MKSISITCIICGSLVFAAPMLYQFGTFALCAYALANTHLSPMNISSPALADGYHIGSLLFGVALTVTGIVFAISDQRRVPASDVPRRDAVSPLAQPGNA